MGTSGEVPDGTLAIPPQVQTETTDSSTGSSRMREVVEASAEQLRSLQQFRDLA